MGYGILSPDKADDSVNLSAVQKLAGLNEMDGAFFIRHGCSAEGELHGAVPRLVVGRAAARAHDEHFANIAWNQDFLVGAVSRSG